MHPAKPQKNGFGGANRLPRLVFNDANRASEAFFYDDASLLPRFAFHETSQAPNAFFGRC